MKAVTRRTFLAASASAFAAPALAAPRRETGLIDAVVVGAGAAGIAAARRLAAANKRFVVVEAMDRIGGRCFTETQTFGVPYDHGAHWIRTPDVNPVAKLAARSGLDVYPAPGGEKLRIGRRDARTGELEDYLAAIVRATRAIGDAARGKTDVSCAQVLPKDLGDLRPSVEFYLGPFSCGKNLEEMSVMDFSRSGERDVDAFCRQGFGALLARLAQGLPVQLSTSVSHIDVSRRQVELRTSKGYLTARSAIVTASTGVLGAGKIRFDPELPRRYTDAIAKLGLGSYDHVALELPGNPLGLQTDDLVFEKASGPRTAALLANVSGTSLCLVDVGGAFGRDLAGQGEAAMVEFALDWLAGMFGAQAKSAVKRTHATQWSKEPWVLGAFSAAAPGGQPGRRALMEPFRDRLFFAGEAVHETLWGTVGGAWESGERAAAEAIRRMGR
ncbi:MAG TPA: NAD(P)/FAD-dependent oxidoreductase [Xanthobacteraceae bacterium]|jgi:monoamine oxidase|nr:NAD(P)/FAD-dependent oxidoreductase [Xanthobacteraceae bacterium]